VIKVRYCNEEATFTPEQVRQSNPKALLDGLCSGFDAVVSGLADATASARPLSA
jgi:hypothetical protein